jgi:hypothetical protein
MSLDILCVEHALVVEVSGQENCPCSTSDTCGTKQYCDTTIGGCVALPTGLGETCSTTEDCESYEADFCDVGGSSTCLKQGCSVSANDCPEGYDCCDFDFLGLPTLCIEEARYETECVQE